MGACTGCNGCNGRNGRNGCNRSILREMGVLEVLQRMLLHTATPEEHVAALQAVVALLTHEEDAATMLRLQGKRAQAALLRNQVAETQRLLQLEQSAASLASQQTERLHGELQQAEEGNAARVAERERSLVALQESRAQQAEERRQRYLFEDRLRAALVLDVGRDRVGDKVDGLERDLRQDEPEQHEAVCRVAAQVPAFAAAAGVRRSGGRAVAELGEREGRCGA